MVSCGIPTLERQETKWQSLLRRIPIRQRGYVCQGRSSEGSFVCRHHDNYNALLEPWKYRQPRALFQARERGTQSDGVVNDPLPLHTRFLPSQCPREDWDYLGSL